jgi:UDP-N-acetylmuramoylalanine--D-glutamate ligase
MNSRAVLGLGIENLALVKYLLAHSETVTVCDSRDQAALGNRYCELKEGGISFRLGPDYLANLTDFTEVFRSPGLPLFEPHVQRARAAGVHITSAMRLFLDLCPCTIIGVTGTKGKGTTSSLIHRILDLSQAKKGHRAFLGGNIGIAPFKFLAELESEDLVVLELSSFQLEDFEKSVDIAVITNITEDHLAPADPVNPNYHKSRADYITAKTNLFRHQGFNGVTILNMVDPTSRELQALAPGRLLTYGDRPQPQGAWYVNQAGVDVIRWNLTGAAERLISSAAIQVRGKHNLLNIAAAALASRTAGADLESIREGISGYQGLEHRLEYVATVNEVQFFDDSFATAPDPTIVALKAFSEPIVLIAGGADKGADFSVLAEEILRRKVTAVILIGVTGPKIGNALREMAVSCRRPLPELVYGCKNMTEIVAAAVQKAALGGIVLLSTACASFGMFKNYKERGDLFKNEVYKLMSQ